MNRLGDSLAVQLTGVALLALAEGVVVNAYVGRGVVWHLVLHSLIGLGLGLAAGGLVASVRGRPTGPLRWAALGQLVSIGPDLLFVAARLPHEGWMDVFVGHISIHTSPAPLLVALTVFLLGSSAWFAGSALRRSLGARLLVVATVAVLGVALALHSPIPTTLEQYSTQYGSLPFRLC